MGKLSMEKESLGKERFLEKITGNIDIMDDNELERIEKANAESERYARIELFISQVPKRYQEVEFDGDHRLLEAQRSVIYGPYGTGKTWTGYAIARELYVNGQIETFRVAREREIYNNVLAYQSKPGEVKKLYYDVDFLVIDEFGKSSNSDASASQIFDIIDYRYDWKKRTVLICNASTPEELRKIVPEAVQDRFVGSTHLLGGKSWRKPE